MSDEPRRDEDYCLTAHFNLGVRVTPSAEEGSRRVSATWCMLHNRWISYCAYKWFLAAKKLDPGLKAENLDIDYQPIMSGPTTERWLVSCQGSKPASRILHSEAHANGWAKYWDEEHLCTQPHLVQRLPNTSQNPEVGSTDA